MENDKTYSLFPQDLAKIPEQSDSVETIKRLESSVFNSFSARRNAARINHYFINLHSSRFIIFTYAFTVFLTIFVIVATIVLTNDLYVDFINENAVSMMNTIHNRISSSINAILQQPKFFTNVISRMLEEPAIIEPSSETAVNISRMLHKSDKAGSGYIIFWDIGLPWGELISIESYETGHVLIYCNTSQSNLGYISYWNTDQFGRNSSYPTHDGIPMKLYNATDMLWYRTAVQAKNATLTDIYEGVGSKGNVLIVSSVAPSMKNGTITSVTSQGIRLEIAQEVLLSQQPSNNSRLALTTSTGTVLAITGDDKLPTDEFSDFIVTKQLTEIEDYIWSCITSNPNFESANHIQCNFRNNLQEFHLSREILEPAPGVNWILWSVLSQNDFIGNLDTVFKESLIYILVIVVCVWIFIVLGSFLLNAYIESKQNKFLEKDSSKEYKHHVKSVGVIFAIQKLRKLRSSNADNPIISSEISSVIDSLQSPKHELLYNRNKVYKQIDNPEVKNALVGLYGVPPPQITYSFPLAPTPSQQQVSSTMKVSAVPQTDSSLPPTSSQSNDSTGFSLQGLQPSARLRPVASSISLGSEGGQSTRLCPLQISPDLMKNRVLMIFLQCNSKCSLFQNDDFQIIIEATLQEIGDPISKLATDSIDFLHTLFRKFDNLYIDPDTQMAILISSIAWHLFMKDRNKEENNLERINRYFLTDSKDFKVMIRNFLLALYVKRANNDEHNRRWDNFSLIVMSLAETSPISLHHTIIAKFALMSKWISQKKKLTQYQITIFAQLLFNLSMVSFLFHPEQFRIAFTKILNPDYEENMEKIQNFSHCIFTELIDPTVCVLRSICEPQFFLSMRCE